MRGRGQGTRVVCSECRGSVEVIGGWVEVRELVHRPGCGLGRQLGEIAKPILLHERGGDERTH
jgi:hypothetical protein